MRKGYTDFVPVQDNRSYTPDTALMYPQYLSKEIQELLIDNGSLNSDLSVNKATARRLGWSLRERKPLPKLQN